ncbi:hypothetical protein HMPREF0083_03077 [Aneurinibacillus aneurinilyticus ATCC 12856]|uniref:Uncharacterized protein n=1 Tax=Aneurinibacillus aneurinilyticus ATCC 12856 TaxID=649747 RepID=U1YDK3_ANEAE|nr:hypothetical protein HMPREF0083_03077 [Aneurinibacillus aneurinilyticus ATCC 12856]
MERAKTTILAKKAGTNNLLNKKKNKNKLPHAIILDNTMRHTVVSNFFIELHPVISFGILLSYHRVFQKPNQVSGYLYDICLLFVSFILYPFLDKKYAKK